MQQTGSSFRCNRFNRTGSWFATMFESLVAAYSCCVCIAYAAAGIQQKCAARLRPCKYEFHPGLGGGRTPVQLTVTGSSSRLVAPGVSLGSSRE